MKRVECTPTQNIRLVIFFFAFQLHFEFLNLFHPANHWRFPCESFTNPRFESCKKDSNQSRILEKVGFDPNPRIPNQIRSQHYFVLMYFLKDADMLSPNLSSVRIWAKIIGYLLNVQLPHFETSGLFLDLGECQKCRSLGAERRLRGRGSLRLCQHQSASLVRHGYEVSLPTEYLCTLF